MKLDYTQNMILKDAIKTYGPEKQIEMMIEECAELIQALQKLKRKPDDEKTINHVCEEIADVEILIFQMHQIFDESEINNWADMKITRLSERLQAKKTM